MMSRAVALLVSALVGLIASPAPAQIAPPKHGVELPPGYHERLRQNRDAFQFKRAWKAATQRARERRDELRREGVLRAGSVIPGTRVEGTRRVPVLVGTFANTGSDPYSDVDLAQQLFDGPNPTGTVTDFYDEISYGAMNLTGDVIGDPGGGLFRVSQDDSYYEAGCSGLCGNARTGEYLKELLDAADPRVDFSQYDNDGPDGIPNSGDDDGYVDFVAFVHPERGGECGGPNIWSHRWVYEAWWGDAYTTDDPAAGGGFIRVSDYTIQPLVSCDGSSLIEIGVFAHEFGHAFGLPDLYDTDPSNGSSAGIGHWCLMASGSWGGDGNHPETPCHMSAWCKEMLGWVEPEIVSADRAGAMLPAVADSAVVLKVYPHGIADDEYFLVENRVKTGFDTWLHGSGLAVWHVDNRRQGNGDETHKLVDLEEADGLFDMDNSRNRGDSGDVFPGSSSVTVFDDDTVPSARDYQGVATGFSLTAFGGGADPRSFDITVTEPRLAVTNVVVDDAPYGNNSGSLDGNERVSLGVDLRNDFDDDVTGVRGTLVSLTPGVSVIASEVTFGTVTHGVLNPGDGRFEIESTGPVADGSSVVLRLDLIGDGGYSSSAPVSLYAGNYVVLVEDDGDADNSILFEDAIASAGYPVVVHDTATDGLPSAGLLEGALAVVWYTGIQGWNTLSSTEQERVRNLLDGGGNLFITGQDLGWGLVEKGSVADRLFYETYLHAVYVTDTTGDNTLVGVTGDPVGDGISLNLDGGSGAGNSTWPSEISAGPGAFPVFDYSPGTTGAIRYEAGHKLVYFAFNFEAVDNAPDRAATMDRVLGWLTPTDLTPPEVTLFGPSAGDTLSGCADRVITWSATDNVRVAGVDLYYSDDSGQTWNPIATALSNSGSYAWQGDGLAGDAFRVKVLARDPRGLQGLATSGDFSIRSELPGVRVEHPNGSEIFTRGAPITVSWTMSDSCSGGLDSARVQLSLDGGRTWVRLATMFPPATSFTWNGGTSVSDSALVRVTVFDDLGTSATDESDRVFSIVDPSLSETPPEFLGIKKPVLLQNYPNPMTALSTNFAFYLPEETSVDLRIFDIRGRLVRTVVAETVPAGYHRRPWDGRDDAGHPVAAGIYFYVMNAGGRAQMHKLTVLR